MKSLVWLCALVFVVASRNEQVPLDESGKKGRLEIAVFDAFGEAIPTPRVIIQGTGTGQPAITISYTNAVELDYGTYTITAEQSGYGRAKVDTTLSNPYTVLVLGTRGTRRGPTTRARSSPASWTARASSSSRRSTARRWCAASPTCTATRSGSWPTTA